MDNYEPRPSEMNYKPSKEDEAIDFDSVNTNNTYEYRLKHRDPPIVYSEVERLTRRDQFAMAAMSGLLSNSENSWMSRSEHSEQATLLADSLIKELDKEIK